MEQTTFIPTTKEKEFLMTLNRTLRHSDAWSAIYDWVMLTSDKSQPIDVQASRVTDLTYFYDENYKLRQDFER